MCAHRPTTALLTAEDLYGMPEEDERYELVEGRLVVSEPPGWTHGSIAANIAALLLGFVRPRRLGAVVVESGYVLARGPDTVRGPDVSFVRADRVPHADVAHRFYEGAPDLAVEIVSPDDRAREIARKVANYLQAGTRAVWVVYPDLGTVVVHTPDGLSRRHGAGDRSTAATRCRGSRVAPTTSCRPRRADAGRGRRAPRQRDRACRHRASRRGPRTRARAPSRRARAARARRRPAAACRARRARRAAAGSTRAPDR